MVLSNKKLKAKLRGELTNSIVDAPSSSSNSLKLLLDSASHKPILSKREKRRKLQPLQPLHKNEQTNKENDTEGSDKKKNNKKRKRKVENQNNDNDDVANVVVSNDAVTNQSKKKKKEKKKIENQNDDEVANGVVSNDIITKQSEKKKQKKNEDVANGVASSDAVTTQSKKKKQQQKKKKQQQKKKKKAKTPEENGSTREGEVLDSTLPELTKTNTTTTTTSQESDEVPTKVYVGGIPYYSTEDDIRSYFEGCGTITGIDCMYFPETGIAFIGFKKQPVRISCAVPLKKKPATSKKLGAIEKSGAGEKPVEKPSPPIDSKMKGRTCYECGKKGHSFSACPNKGTVTSTTI